MPYEIESHQQRKINEQGSVDIFGDRTHIGRYVWVSQAYRDETNGKLVWRQVWEPDMHTYLAGYIFDYCFDKLVPDPEPVNAPQV